MKKNPLINSFWQHREETAEGCWRWLGGKNKNGYGVVKYRGRAVYVHRLAYKIVHKRFPRRGYVLHSCDHKWCYNPAHLSGGGQSTNMKQWARTKKRKPLDIHVFTEDL